MPTLSVIVSSTLIQPTHVFMTPVAKLNGTMPCTTRTGPANMTTTTQALKTNATGYRADSPTVDSGQQSRNTTKLAAIAIRRICCIGLSFGGEASQRKTPENFRAGKFGGGPGIRTLGEGLPHNGFQDRLLRPLGQPSLVWPGRLDYAAGAVSPGHTIHRWVGLTAGSVGRLPASLLIGWDRIEAWFFLLLVGCARLA